MKNLINAFVVLFLTSYNLQASDKTFPTTTLSFTENKGQVNDQYGQSRNDIQFVLKGDGISVFIGNGQLHYQFIHALNQPPDMHKALIADPDNCRDERCQLQTYRMDVTLQDANMQAPVVAEDRQAYYENYYTPGTGNGVQVHTFKRITYRNVYPGIDWVLYINGNTLEHEFVVARGADASKIKLQYSGQTSLNIAADGSVVAATPMGTIKEQAPVCYDASGNKINARYQLDGDVLSYGVKTSGKTVIDPEVEWATYYGDNGVTTYPLGAVSDGAGNIYFGGLTYSDATGTIATTGSHQYIYGGGSDAYLVKFDSTGARIWGTYYGGSNGDWTTGVACDAAGNVYLGGATGSTTGIATAGAQQTVFGGGSWDAFVAKFNSAGVRQWGTYLGGTGANAPLSVCTDNSGHVYMSGTTSDPNNIASAGSFKPVKGGGYECYLVQYDVATGLRTWGTYYGGSSNEFSGASCSDGTFVYLAGFTASATGISTSFAFQPSLIGAGTDAFVAKFDVSGTRLWGSYYGGEGSDVTGGIISDGRGNLYLLGATSSDTGIATSGCAQPVRHGMNDAFLFKIESELGYRLWGTYYGGTDMETVDLSKMVCDDSFNVYITGYTLSTTGIATSNAYQHLYGGGDDDAFMAKYSPDGILQWGTYYGGSTSDEGMACAWDGRSVYLAGRSNSTDSIATPGSYLSTGGGSPYYQVFLTKFGTTHPPLHAVPFGQQAGNMTIYPVPNSGSFTIAADLNGSTSACIIITDLAGKTVWTGNAAITNGKLNKQITLSNVPSGIYFVKLVSDKETEVKQFVIE